MKSYGIALLSGLLGGISGIGMSTLTNSFFAQLIVVGVVILISSFLLSRLFKL